MFHRWLCSKLNKNVFWKIQTKIRKNNQYSVWQAVYFKVKYERYSVRSPCLYWVRNVEFGETTNCAINAIMKKNLTGQHICFQKVVDKGTPFHRKGYSLFRSCMSSLKIVLVFCTTTEFSVMRGVFDVYIYTWRSLIHWSNMRTWVGMVVYMYSSKME